LCLQTLDWLDATITPVSSDQDALPVNAAV